MKNSRFSKQVIIHPYDGFQGETHVVLSGRVLYNRKVVFLQNQSKFKNFINSWNNFITNEIEGIKVILTYDDLEVISVTNKEGYFNFKVDVSSRSTHISKLSWVNCTVSLDPDDVRKYQKESIVEAQARIYVSKPNCKFGVISDIDDTLVVTNVSTLLRWRMFYNSIFFSPFQRKVFIDANRIINLLANRVEKECPVFYISNSPNNLYFYVKTILNNSKFYDGPIFLRDIGRQLLRSRDFTEGNKYRQSFDLFKAYPHKKFMLLGDAAESDIHIYMELARVFSGRVHFIAIRSLGNKKKDQSILTIKEGCSSFPIVLFNDIVDLENQIKTLDIE